MLSRALPRRWKSIGASVGRRRRRSMPAFGTALEDRVRQLPAPYLRAMDASNFDVQTYQRSNVKCDPVNGKPLPTTAGVDASVMTITSISELEAAAAEDPTTGSSAASSTIRITWSDGHVSDYSSAWLEHEVDRYHGASSTSRTPWTNLTEADVRSTSKGLSWTFEHVLENRQGQSDALQVLFDYGIVLITQTPLHDDGAGVAALAAALGGGLHKNAYTSLLPQYLEARTNSDGQSSSIVLPHGTDGPLRTLYGTVWSTTSSGQAEGASTADSAYGQEALPLHTDMTYHQDPPGLQIFTMVQPALTGGQSIVADGFAAAALLKERNPAAYNLLAQTPRRYRSMDPVTGWHLEAVGPLLECRPNGLLVRIRHNDLDRLPDLPPPNVPSVENFYEQLDEAHRAWDEILALDEIRLVLSLQPGDTLIVANQRCFHGRYSFETSPEQPRMIMGCYVSQDELDSRFRQEGFLVH